MASLRHDESNLAKVAGFTNDAKRSIEAKSGNEIDDWESWRQEYAKTGKVKETRSRSGWIGLIVLFCTIGILVPLWLISQYEDDVTTAVNELPADDTKHSLPATIGLTSEEIARRFLAAETIEERLLWTRDPERVTPLMRDYYANRHRIGDTNGNLRENVLDLRSFSTIVVKNGFLYEGFHVKTPTGNRLLAVCETSDGRRVDWECYVRYNPLSWRRFFNQAAGSGSSEFRVFFSQTDFHKQLSPDADHTFYWIESPELNTVVYGYVENNSPTAETLLLRSAASPATESASSKFIATGPNVAPQRRQRAILSLRHVSMNSSGHIVEITGIKHLGWVTPE
ncbi:MAG: hypothetical protein KDN22_12810 [Verrucomicrobiae bacterium]|nr:hypothetical protein [Verrucomicrobiae bacterium]